MRIRNHILWPLAALFLLVSACDFAPGSTVNAQQLQSYLTPPATAAPGPSETLRQQMASLVQCESGGNYAIVSGNGLYRGAYQFLQSSWNGVAERAGRPDLVGVDPAKASPADQDAMALHLHSELGWKPWPGCTKKLGLR